MSPLPESHALPHEHPVNFTLGAAMLAPHHAAAAGGAEAPPSPAQDATSSDSGNATAAALPPSAHTLGHTPETAPALDLAAIRARCDAAAPGRWEAYRVNTIRPLYGVGAGDVALTQDLHTWPDAAFIAHARQDVPALLAELARLQQHADRLAALATADRLEREQALRALVVEANQAGRGRLDSCDDGWDKEDEAVFLARLDAILAAPAAGGEAR
jgi:hypothetical protein